MKDMTKGSPFRLILLFALPMLLGNLLQQFYNIVDTAIVGRILGPGALSGTAGRRSWFLFFYMHQHWTGCILHCRAAMGLRRGGASVCLRCAPLTRLQPAQPPSAARITGQGIWTEFAKATESAA